MLSLAKSRILTHISGGIQEGENLYWGWASDHKQGTFVQAMQAWLNEESNYHGESIGQGNLADWGHYSKFLKIVWWSSEIWGCHR